MVSLTQLGLVAVDAYATAVLVLSLLSILSMAVLDLRPWLAHFDARAGQRSTPSRAGDPSVGARRITHNGPIFREELPSEAEPWPHQL